MLVRTRSIMASPTGYAALLLLGACPPAPLPPTVPLPPPCVGDSTIYSRADESRGVLGASPKALWLPEHTRDRGAVRVRLLVTPTGAVLRDSTHVTTSGSRELDAAVRAAAERTTFTPATRGTCAVSFWYELTVSR